MRLTYYITLFSVRPQGVQQFLQSLAEVCVSQEFCDVSVRCEDGLLSSHSLLLSAGVTAVLLTCSYKDNQEFLRVGYYVNVEYD